MNAIRAYFSSIFSAHLPISAAEGALPSTAATVPDNVFEESYGKHGRGLTISLQFLENKPILLFGSQSVAAAKQKHTQGN